MTPKILPWLLLASSLAALPLQAQTMTDYDLLVGTYTQGSSKGIYRFAFDPRSGRIEPQARQLVEIDNPSWLTLSNNQRYLFAVNENGPGQRDQVGRVSSFSIEPGTHVLNFVNQVESKGDEPTHSSLSPDERFLFVANYAVHPVPGGSLAVLPLDDMGNLGPVQQTSSGTPSRVDPERQQSSHVHSATPTPDGRYLVAADLGADALMVFPYNGASAAAPLSDARIVRLPPGSGPRHLAFDRAGRHAYLTLEMAGKVAVFDYQDGQFSQVQLLDLTNPGSGQKNGGGGLHLSPDGRFLYVANRGDANQLLVYAVDSSSGQLREVQRRSVEGREPREFSLDPTGHFMLIANQKSDQIVTIKVDPETGLLGDTVQKLNLGAPSDFVFLTR